MYMYRADSYIKYSISSTFSHVRKGQLTTELTHMFKVNFVINYIVFDYW